MRGIHTPDIFKIVYSKGSEGMNASHKRTGLESAFDDE